MASCAWCRFGTETRVSKEEEETPVSAEENEALVRRYFEEGWVKRNLAAADDFMVPNYVEHQIPDGRLTSRHSLKQLLATYYKAFPDMKSVLHDILAQGDRVMYRWSVNATHLGDWLGIPPPGLDLERSPAFDSLIRNLTWRFRAAEAQERERIEHELQVARQIQQELLPEATPDLDGWQIAAYYGPAREVGGDFYDFLEFPDGRLGLVVGDATGHGMPAALVMATTRGMLRAVVQSLESPGEVLSRVNEALVADVPPSTFVTCFYGILDPESGRFVYANAGHNLPCRRHDGQADELRARGMPLGLMPGMGYEEKEITLKRGEGVLFYSDGLVEAHDPHYEMFGFPRL